MALAGGWVREMALVSAFVPCGAELCLPGLNTSPSWCPLALLLPEQSCSLFHIPDVKSRWLSELMQSGPSAFACQTWGLCLAGGLPLHCPGSLPPVSVARTTSPPFLPSSVGLLSTLGSGESILLVFWWFYGLFSRFGWNLSDQQDR